MLCHSLYVSTRCGTLGELGHYQQTLVCVSILCAIMVNVSKVTIFLCAAVNVNNRNKKEAHPSKRNEMFLRVMLGLYILAHYFILDEDHVV